MTREPLRTVTVPRLPKSVLGDPQVATPLRRAELPPRRDIDVGRVGVGVAASVWWPACQYAAPSGA